MIGFVNVYKRSGDTSTFVVNKIKKIFGVKCGHMGTLDPLASGVLPVALGQASRAFDHLLDKEKTYIARFDFNYTTASLDLETPPERYSERVVEREEIEKAIKGFVGNIEQVPPAYSAKCVGGTKAYKLARRGRSVELKPKTVFVKSFKIIDKISDNVYDYEIVCKGGTYIRSLCRDLAYSLGVVGVMTRLERVSSGVFNRGNSCSIVDLEKAEDISRFVIPVDSAFDYEKTTLCDEDYKRILNGLTEGYPFKDGVYRAYNGDGFIGIMTVTGGKVKITYIRDL